MKIEKFKVLCTKCGNQVKTDSMIFIFAPNYRYLQCNKCLNPRFYLAQEK